MAEQHDGGDAFEHQLRQWPAAALSLVLIAVAIVASIVPGR